MDTMNKSGIQGDQPTFVRKEPEALRFHFGDRQRYCHYNLHMVPRGPRHTLYHSRPHDHRGKKWKGRDSERSRAGVFFSLPCPGRNTMIYGQQGTEKGVEN